MPGTEMSTTEKSASGDGEEILLEDYLQLQSRLNEARSVTLSLIDESANVLLDCMKSANKRAQAQDLLDFRQVNSVANLGKQIAQMAKVKLDAIKEARK
jgi:hypothetical protein